MTFLLLWVASGWRIHLGNTTCAKHFNMQHAVDDTRWIAIYPMSRVLELLQHACARFISNGVLCRTVFAAEQGQHREFNTCTWARLMFGATSFFCDVWDATLASSIHRKTRQVAGAMEAYIPQSVISDNAN